MVNAKTTAEVARQRVELKKILRCRGVPFNKDESTDLLQAKVLVSS